MEALRWFPGLGLPWLRCPKSAKVRFGRLHCCCVRVQARGYPLLSTAFHCCCVRVQARGYGAPEIVTCGRDGCVRVWDVRQHDAPVAAFEPADTDNIRDCW